jgi:predicted nuclease of predicted toxin-antitoxin system
VAQLPRFLIDPNVSNRLVTELRARGHTVERVDEVMGDKVTDAAIVAYATREYAVIITKNTQHFNMEARKAIASGRTELRRWGLICVNCVEPRVVARFQQLYEIIMDEYRRASVDRHDQGLLLHMEIDQDKYTIHY